MDIGTNVRIYSRVKLDKTNPRGIHIGDNTGISFGVSILSHDFIHRKHMDTYVGNNCFIGAMSIILPGVRIGDHCIIGAGSVVMHDIPDRSIVMGNPARVVRGNIMTEEYGILHRDSIKDSINYEEYSALSVNNLEHPDLYQLIMDESNISDMNALMLPIDDSGVDSFTLITLRSSLESRLNVRIPDKEWMSIGSLADILTLPSMSKDRGTARMAAPTGGPPAGPARDEPVARPETTPASNDDGRRRRYTLNMPQMALSGLSEAWLFKELGDVHWGALCGFLRTPSREITDDVGDRLYATFTRILLKVDPSLRSFRENDEFDLRWNLRRHGAGIYLCDHRVTGASARCEAVTMSTFAKYGEKGKNTSLIKGTPTIPDPDALPPEKTLPEFVSEYRARRAANRSESVFECRYEMQPPHDINGVGLLYFAAYPTIFDLCIGRFEGNTAFFDYSTSYKDICYFANAEPGEAIDFRLHERVETDGSLKHACSLYRSSDGTRMADLVSIRRKLGKHG